MGKMEITYKPRYERSAELVRHLARGAALLEGIRSRPDAGRWVPRARRDALVRHAHYSSRIEGNPLTLPEVAALAEGRNIPVEDHARREILNYLAAMRWIWERGVKQGISERSLLHVHGLLTAGLVPATDSGHYKTVQNAVYRGRAVIYRPPPPEAAPLLTRALVGWINSGGARKEHPIVVAAVAHHRFVSIHPVLDGNGRLGRLLEAWILYARDFDTQHIFALPEFYEADRERYYREIEKVRAQGEDLTSWLEFVACGVVETLDKTRRRIDRQEYSGTAAALRLNESQKAIMGLLASGQAVSGPELCSELRISRSLLSRWLKPLVEARLVVREGATKGARYRLGPGGAGR
jgi:Fic family protein